MPSSTCYTREVKKIALITGASSGFGSEFAKLFARDGYDLILVARSQDVLESLARELKREFDIFVKVIAIDLSDSKSPEKIFEIVETANLTVNVLINNAGFATYGEFVKLPKKDELDEIAVNVVSLTHLTKLFLPGMVQRKEGRILNVASTAAFLPGPLMAVYYATKAYVLHFSEALSEELKGTGVTVTVLCPGPSKTGFSTRAKLENSPLFNGHIMDAKKIVAIGYKGLMQDQTVIIPGILSKFLIEVPRFFSRSFMRRVIKKMQTEKTGV
ncbi:SDR family oxidoreductase [soil metagenome]